MAEKSKRKQNWTWDETLLLAQLVNENKRVLRGKFGPGITAKEKKTTWDNICDQINASFPHVRRVSEEIEKKWYNVLAKSRIEISNYKREGTSTGGGPASKELSSVAKVVHDVLGENNVTITGLPAGVDSTLLQIYDLGHCMGGISEPCSISSAVIPSEDAPIPAEDICPSLGCAPQTYTSHEETLKQEERQLRIEVLRLQKEYFQLKIKKIKKYFE